MEVVDARQVVFELRVNLFETQILSPAIHQSWPVRLDPGPEVLQELPQLWEPGGLPFAQIREKEVQKLPHLTRIESSFLPAIQSIDQKKELLIKKLERLQVNKSLEPRILRSYVGDLRDELLGCLRRIFLESAKKLQGELLVHVVPRD